jgi:hypothetical protein
MCVIIYRVLRGGNISIPKHLAALVALLPTAAWPEPAAPAPAAPAPAPGDAGMDLS